MPVIKGIEQLYYAIMTTEDTLTSQAIYGTPVRLPALTSVKATPSVDTQQLWSDDALDETVLKTGSIVIELTVKDLTPAMQAALLGETYVSGVLTGNASDIPPYVAIGWMAKKSNNNFRYCWYLKGKFEPVADANDTEADKVKLQPAVIKGTFFPRKYDGKWKRILDQDDPSYIASQGTNWFAYVETTPPVLTCVAAPIQGATAVPKAAAVITWTYSNIIANGQLLPTNFSVVATTTGVAVPGTISIDGTGKIVTFTPTSSLAATTLYMAIADMDVLDGYGQHLAANTTTTWTTGA